MALNSGIQTNQILTNNNNRNHDLMASVWEKAISNLAGNLNSGFRYLITVVTEYEKLSQTLKKWRQSK